MGWIEIVEFFQRSQVEVITYEIVIKEYQEYEELH